MKRFMLNTFMFTLAVALWGCGGSDNDEPQPAVVSIDVSQETIAVPAEGGTYTVSVTTTGKEWGAYADQDFIAVNTTNTVAQSGTLKVTVPANPTTSARTGTVTVMSGAARKVISVSQTAAAQSAYYAPDGYTLVWNDEFDGNYGYAPNENGIPRTELNPNDWTHEVKSSGWVNHELQNYVNHKTPEGKLVTELRDGKLRITALKENGKVYSGRVYAKVKEGWKYGYIEASIKLPKGKGTWPAFWMMPVNFRSWPADGEIDIMEEVGYHPDYVSSSLHANAHVHSNNTQVTHEMLCQGAEGEFHTYAILWTAQNITTYVDGKVQLSYDNRGKGRDDWPYDDPFYVIFNLAWGGDWGGAQGVDEGALPVTMEVDYIRVFQKQ
ncbi:MAG: family 16 glycosylhydrolase [Prevotella sp.]|jgi:beta-glucanase (GH16 family)|nr:family 16 glycosylhydrolase [Prevotella sp.]